MDAQPIDTERPLKSEETPRYEFGKFPKPLHDKAVSQILKPNTDLLTTSSGMELTPVKDRLAHKDTKDLVKHFEDKFKTFQNKQVKSPATRLFHNDPPSSGFTSGNTSSETGYNNKKVS